MPPMSRSRSWRTISSAASRLFFVTVSSRLPPEPVNLPVLTSTTVIASVRSMTSEPPDGQPHLALQRLGDLLVDPVLRRTTSPSPVVPLEAVHQVRRDVRDVLVDHVPGVVAGDDELAEVLGEQVAHDLERRCPARRTAAAGALPVLTFSSMSSQRAVSRLDVPGELLLAGALGGGADDDACAPPARCP